MDSPKINGHSLKTNGHPSPSSHSPHPALKKELSNANTPITSPGRTPSSDSPVNHDTEMKQETVGGEIVVKQEPGQPAKLSRSSSQKIVARPPQLFSHLPDSTADALATFEQIETCWYANKYMGFTEHAMECDCAEEWGMYSFFFRVYFLILCFVVCSAAVSPLGLEGGARVSCWKPPQVQSVLQDGVYPQRIRCPPLKCLYALCVFPIVLSLIFTK